MKIEDAIERVERYNQALREGDKDWKHVKDLEAVIAAAKRPMALGEEERRTLVNELENAITWRDSYQAECNQENKYAIRSFAPDELKFHEARVAALTSALSLAGPGFTVEEWEDLRDCIKVSRQEHFSHLEDGQKASRERHAALWNKAVALLAKLDAYLETLPK